jgi:hypothetical protein
MGKLTAVIALGAGYVLGTRAGRERYEQIRTTAVNAAQRPEVQQARDRLKTVAGDKLKAGTRRVTQPPVASPETVVVDESPSGAMPPPTDFPEPFPEDLGAASPDAGHVPGTDPLR